MRHRVDTEFIGSRNCVSMAFTAESPSSCPLYTNSGCGKKKAALVTGITTSRTAGFVPADFQQ